MAEKQTITIDDVEYKYEDMSSDQQMMINHIADLDRKIKSTRFNLDQLQVGRDAFMVHLKKNLEEAPVIEEESKD
mgnify:FL=1|tara:strand:- start:60 stop:284 length:225 start_codon:yes stop_codon:yes gene_type:complete